MGTLLWLVLVRRRLRIGLRRQPTGFAGAAARMRSARLAGSAAGCSSDYRAASVGEPSGRCWRLIRADAAL